MLEHVDSTSIAASPDTVYDAACALDWLDPEIAVTRISDAGDGVSGSYRLRMHVLGSEHSAVLEVEAGADGRRVGFSSVDCKECTIDGMYLLEPSGSGTRVSLRLQAQPHGRYRFMKPLIIPVLHKSVADALARLKAHVEEGLAEAAGSSPDRVACGDERRRRRGAAGQFPASGRHDAGGGVPARPGGTRRAPDELRQP